jgi:hypothetical protein
MEAITVSDLRVPLAVEMLKGVGMIQHGPASPKGSVYLRLPGRLGTLRVSDHRAGGHKKRGVVQSLTFGLHMRADAPIDDAVAHALGRYMLRAPKENADA